MKKLLYILGSISITASSATLVVACGKDDDSSDTGTIFIDNGGNLKIDSEDLLNWYTENVGFGNPITVVKQFYRLFAVAILQNAQNKGKDSIFSDDNTNNPYALENMQEKLKNIIGDKDNPDQVETIYGAANKAFKDRKGDLSDSELADQLADQFPNVKDDFNSLKNAYISNFVINDSDNNAYTRLTKLFSADFQTGLDNEQISNSASLLSAFRQNWGSSTVGGVLTASTVGTIYDVIKKGLGEENKDNSKYINLINLLNATGGVGTGGVGIITSADNNGTIWDATKIKWATDATKIVSATNDDKLLKDLLGRIVENFGTQADAGVSINDAAKGNNTVSYHYSYINANGDPLTTKSTYFDLVNTYPSADGEQKLSNDTNNGIYGFLSNSQRFLVDSYYQAEKPLSISEVVFSKGANGDLSTNIDATCFFDETTTTSVDQFTGLVDFLNSDYIKGGVITNTSQTAWDTIFANDTPSENGKIFIGDKDKLTTWNTEDSTFYKTSYDSTLLTLSDTTHSDILKYSAYDFLQNENESDEDFVNFDINSINDAKLTNVDKDGLSNYGFDSAIANALATKISEFDSDQTTPGPAKSAFIKAVNLIDSLNRKVDVNDTSDGEWDSEGGDDQKAGKMYHVLNAKQGIIAFIDTDGLHITKINGYNKLREMKATDIQKTVEFDGNEDKYINESNSFKQLASLAKSEKTNGNYRYIYGDYESAFAPKATSGANKLEDSDSGYYIQNSTIENTLKYGLDYSSLNQSISNDYERYLVNTSINSKTSDTKNEAFYKYSIIDSATEYGTSKDSSTTELSEGGSWLFDYICAATGKTQEELFDSLFKIDDNNSELSGKFNVWINSKLAGASEMSKSTGNITFNEGWKAWSKKIDETKKKGGYGSIENKDLPLSKLATGVDDAHITNVWTSKKFAPFYVDSLATPAFTFVNYSFSTLNSNYYVLDFKRNGGSK